MDYLDEYLYDDMAIRLSLIHDFKMLRRDGVDVSRFKIYVPDFNREYYCSDEAIDQWFGIVFNHTIGKASDVSNQKKALEFSKMPDGSSISYFEGITKEDYINGIEEEQIEITDISEIHSVKAFLEILKIEKLNLRKLDVYHSLSKVAASAMWAEYDICGIEYNEKDHKMYFITGDLSYTVYEQMGFYGDLKAIKQVFVDFVNAYFENKAIRLSDEVYLRKSKKRERLAHKYGYRSNRKVA